MRAVKTARHALHRHQFAHRLSRAQAPMEATSHDTTRSHSALTNETKARCKNAHTRFCCGRTTKNTTKTKCCSHLFFGRKHDASIALSVKRNQIAFAIAFAIAMLRTPMKCCTKQVMQSQRALLTRLSAAIRQQNGLAAQSGRQPEPALQRRNQVQRGESPAAEVANLITKKNAKKSPTSLA